MSYDIYGNPLHRGYCEVHPSVHEEYPCSVCMRESADRVGSGKITRSVLVEQQRDALLAAMEKIKANAGSPEYVYEMAKSMITSCGGVS